MVEITDTIFWWVLVSSIVLGFIFIIINRRFTYLHTLPFFLLFLYVVEQYGQYLGEHGKHNIWLYNYSSVVEFVYYIWIVSKMYFLKKHNKNIYIVTTIYCIISLINIYFYQGKTGFHSITYGIGSLLLIGVCIYYFLQLLSFPNQEVLVKQPQFWISSGLLFSFSCDFPFFCLNNFYSNLISEKIWPILTSVNHIINIVFYSLFVVAFLCKIRFKLKIKTA